MISSGKGKVAIMALWRIYYAVGLILFWTYNILLPKSDSNLIFAGSGFVRNVPSMTRSGSINSQSSQ
jgi:hypothetical protein